MSTPSTDVKIEVKEYTLDLNWAKDPRDEQVLACVRSDAHHHNWEKMKADVVYVNGTWTPVVPNLPAMREICGEDRAGFIYGLVPLPVFIYFSYYKAEKNGKYVVYWGVSRRYGDNAMMEDYVRVRFVNCKMFTDSDNQYGILPLFQ